MIFTTKAEYGVRLLIQLGLAHGGEPLSLKAIAEREQMPLAYLERIAALLRRAELISATRGAHGGYRLTRSPEQIAMDSVVRALEGDITPMDCFSSSTPSRVACAYESDHNSCATNWLWAQVRTGINTTLARTTLAMLVKFAARHGSERASELSEGTVLASMP